MQNVLMLHPVGRVLLLSEAFSCKLVYGGIHGSGGPQGTCAVVIKPPPMK